MRFRGVLWSTCLAIAALVILAILSRSVLIDWSGRPYCHKQVFFGFTSWQETQATKDFPNSDGNSAESLKAIAEIIGVPVQDTYRYVPGLTADDPGDLVLMYIAQPTRWTWHAQPPTILTSKKWILVPVDFKIRGLDRPEAGPGENSERVTFDELQQRLLRTLEFLRENDRPYAETVTREHMQFLESIAAH